MDFGVGSRVAITDECDREARLPAARSHNGQRGRVVSWDATNSTWEVMLDQTDETVLVEEKNLVPLRWHHPVVEPATAVEARTVLSSAIAREAAGGSVSFGGDLAVPAEVAILHVFSLLARCTIRDGTAGGRFVRAGELDVASEVCKEWHGVCLALRAMTPACARDVAVKLRLERPAEEMATGPPLDGEYSVWHLGDRSHPPMTLFMRNALSLRPTEFVTLPEGPVTNLSYFPPGGAAVGNVAMTSFSKLRVCPWTLMVKTDDFTFTQSAGHLVQTYWNGKRTLEVSNVPYATARNAAHTNPRNLCTGANGQAQIDLRGTGFGVSTTGFRAVGCAAWGVVALPTDGCADPESLIQPRVALYGGGYAGRMTPLADRTMDEKSQGGDYDDEGCNGGWVLPLERMPASDRMSPLHSIRVPSIPIAKTTCVFPSFMTPVSPDAVLGGFSMPFIIENKTTTMFVLPTPDASSSGA